MTEVSQSKNREAILKSLAIAGFISIIVFIAWASVKIVNLVPATFTSLASLAESMDQYEEAVVKSEKEIKNLVVTSNTKLANVGEVINLSWSETDRPGSFSFSYECKDGVSIDIINQSGLGAINCDTNYNLGDINELAIKVNSEKVRFQDVNYKIAFLGTDDTTPAAQGEALFTITNPTIADLTPETTTTTEETVSETPTESTNPTPVYEQEFVYTIPTSNPNGRTDIGTKFIAFGNIVGNNFFKGQVKQNESGAIQFEVKNLGNKTSGEWTYEVSLPESETYSSDKQAALKPNERAVITIGFPTPNKTSHTFKVVIKEKTEQNLINNQFSETITFIK